MSEKRIDDLPVASNITDPDLFVLQQTGVAKSLTGSRLKKYAVDSVEPYAKSAEESATLARTLSQHPTKLADNGNWMFFDESVGQYVDSGYHASIIRIQQTGGTHASGTFDTYTAYFGDGTETFSFQVYNGIDGNGAGDMKYSDYDRNKEVSQSGGIKEFIASHIGVDGTVLGFDFGGDDND